MHANLIKYQVENRPALLGQNLVSTCNCKANSVLAGWVEISFWQAGIMQSPPMKQNNLSNGYI